MKECSALVTVLMAAYNAESYLLETLESILAQTYYNFEFLIINDGSEDKTLSILKRYEGKDSRVRVITIENRGLVKSLNTGLNEAKGKYIARIDADDVAFPNRIERQVFFLQENPEIVCVGSYYEVIDERSQALTILDAPVDDTTIQEKLIEGHTVICHPTVMMDRETVLSVGGYIAQFFLVEDLDLWICLGEVGKLANIPEALTQYMFSNSSINSGAGKKQLDRAYPSAFLSQIKFSL